jgi:beta-fructofuranosidase
MAQSWALFLLAFFSFSSYLSKLFICSRNGEGSFLCARSPEVPSIASERYRTAYHFQPPKNWMNGMFISPVSSLILFFRFLSAF